MSFANSFAAAAAAVLGCAALPAQAALGDYLVVAESGHVVLTFEGSEAGYDSVLSVNGSAPFFPNHSTPVGATVDLGYFAAGSVLDAALTVVNTGYVFHTGPGSLNPDQYAHALVVDNWNGTGRTWVGFEDIFGTPTGSGDYNDHTFSFSNTLASPVPGVPEPGTWALMAAGLAALSLARSGARRVDARKAQA